MVVRPFQVIHLSVVWPFLIVFVVDFSIAAVATADFTASVVNFAVSADIATLADCSWWNSVFT